MCIEISKLKCSICGKHNEIATITERDGNICVECYESANKNKYGGF